MPAASGENAPGFAFGRFFATTPGRSCGSAACGGLPPWFVDVAVSRPEIPAGGAFGSGTSCDRSPDSAALTAESRVYPAVTKLATAWARTRVAWERASSPSRSAAISLTSYQSRVGGVTPGSRCCKDAQAIRQWGRAHRSAKRRIASS